MKPGELFVFGLIGFAAIIALQRIMSPDAEPQSVETSRPTIAEARHGTPIPPPEQYSLSATAAMLRLDDDGHYYADADVDGTFVRFLVDTGASTVALTFHDAQRLGLDPASLDYNWRIRTAGGEVLGASVLIGEIKIGRVTVSNVDAMVLRDGLEQSLLGMSFLSELDSYEFKRGSLILRQ